MTTSDQLPVDQASDHGRDPILTDLDCQRFDRDGFIVARNVVDPGLVLSMREFAIESLDPPLAPLEFEADLHYPGAPDNRLAEGGNTPRRLLNAYARGDIFRRLARLPAIIGTVRRLCGSDTIMLSQNHHNCVMTKHPGFSSATLWHQDIRYWSFDRPELINAWVALGRETPENGGMWMLPGTHKQQLDRGRLDAALFLRPELAANRTLIDTRVAAELEAGDVLFFHCRTFHAAGRNNTDDVKLSVVFSYHAADNHPIPGTRSANYPDIPL